MFKKIFAIATVMCVIPVMSNAATKWQLGTRAMSQGGVINSRNMTGQVVANGSVFKQYTGLNNHSELVNVVAGSGFKTSKITVNGIVSAPNATGTTPVTAPAGQSTTIQATFVRTSFAITASAGAGGTVDKSAYPIVYTGVQNPPKSFIFTPAPGQFVSSVVVTGAGASQNLNAITGMPITLPAAVGVKVKTNVTSVASANITVAGTFGGTPAAASATTPAACVNCHAPQGVGGGRNAGGAYFNWSSQAAPRAASCQVCHVGADTGAHPGVTNNNCIGCHSVAAPAHTGNVADNNFGVRAVVSEFSKWSHHVTGVSLNNAHCAACHLEGKAVGAAIVVDKAYHMVGGVTHLRNADTDADMQWNPAAPNHTTMDNYCFSCHDANGATSAGSVAIQAVINGTPGLAAAGKTASASNPFGDTISNRYDKMFRPAVVNVDSQFELTNNSHHGVKGKRYSGRTRTAGDSREIANAAAFAANSTATLWGKRSTIYDGVDAITGVTGGPREAFNQLYVPLQNAGGEVVSGTLKTMNGRTGALPLGDDSTLHCGDCHTVGQFKPGTAQGYTPTDPATIIAGTSVAIGAHGSNNEYLLRNSKATDARHTQNGYTSALGVVTVTNPNGAFLVCFNCHSYERYGSVFNATGTTGPHAGEYDASGRCNGTGNTIPFNGYTTGTLTDGTQFASRFEGPITKYSSAAPYAGEQNADFGNIFGIQCLNCHNSGVGNGYGGIHGSANNSPGTTNNPAPGVAAPAGGAYVDGMGNWNKVERFLPGLGNVMHVPGTLGGVTGGSDVASTTAIPYTYQTGGIANDTNWEQVGWKQAAGTPTSGPQAGAGCYTLGEGATAASLGLEGEGVAGAAGPAEAEVFGTWGGCDDHGAAKGNGDHGFAKRINRPITY